LGGGRDATGLGDGDGSNVVAVSNFQRCTAERVLIRPAARLGDGSSMLFTVLHSGKLSASRRFDASPLRGNSTAARAFQRAAARPRQPLRAAHNLKPPALPGATYLRRSRRDHPRSTGMCFTFSRALADFGSVTVRMPFLNDAATLSSSTSSTGMRRSNRP